MGDLSSSWVLLYTGEQNDSAPTAMPDLQNWYSESRQGCWIPYIYFSPSVQVLVASNLNYVYSVYILVIPLKAVTVNLYLY